METTLPIVTAAGTAAGTFELKAEWLEAEKGEQAVHDTVVALMAARRAGTAAVKTRGQVSGGGKKPWRQKGTGRARAGSIRSPVWRGGGITFGPSPRSFAKKVNGKVRQLALKRAFTERVKEGAVIVVEQIALAEAKTRALVEFLRGLGVGDHAMIVVPELQKELALAGQNLQDVRVVKASSVNTYDMLLHKKVVFSRDGLAAFVQRLSRQEVKA
jgi:large subunit ribosomal protein L4